MTLFWKCPLLMACVTRSPMLPKVCVKGLLTNPAKCTSLRIDADGKAKRWVIDPHSFFSLEDKEIKPLTSSRPINIWNCRLDQKA